ncbi:tetratricopeptide repeat protein [Streptomyces sp. NPDC000410]|uniref:tetratricopeptide repeat protein n=1 Tax=Streptomyces sp. NPDC000410 TaxID=3154254 RepID=UPI0033249062
MSLLALSRMREAAGDTQGADQALRQAVDAGDADALMELSARCHKGGNLVEAERFARRAEGAGHLEGAAQVARVLISAGDPAGAERILLPTVDAGNPEALLQLIFTRNEAGDYEGAAQLAQQASHDDNIALTAWEELIEWHVACAKLEQAEQFAAQAADFGYPRFLTQLAQARRRAGDVERAEQLAQQAEDSGCPDALLVLALIRWATGDPKGADVFVQRAVEAGSPQGLFEGALAAGEAGDPEQAVRLAHRAADAGYAGAVAQLARHLEEAGYQGGELVAQEAGKAEPDLAALLGLADIRERAGDHAAAERLARQAVDAGTIAPLAYRLWPHGLDADGTPLPPW